MKRRVPGLSQAALPMVEVPDGVYLVVVERVHYRWAREKPYYVLRFAVREPKRLAGRPVSGRLWCSERALWKLSWFLRDFGYDTELLGRDELDEKHIVGLQGVVKISHTTVNGRTYLNLDAFASAGEWDEYSLIPSRPENAIADGEEPEVA